MNPYKALWSRIGGRQWTYIMRDFAYQNPFLLIMLAFLLGMWLKTHLNWDMVLPFLGGVLLSHLFWGTKWIRHQGVKPKNLNQDSK